MTRDNYFTPPVALEPLYPYLRKGMTIWEPACGDGHLSNCLKSLGYNVIATDINSGKDFLASTPPNNFDIIITNPPYSLKTEFLSKAFEINKPFAMLLPVDCLGGKKRQKTFAEHRIELIMLGGRIQFINPGVPASRTNFEVAWFTYKMNLPNQLNFTTLTSYK